MLEFRWDPEGLLRPVAKGERFVLYFRQAGLVPLLKT